jgi:hypothetical protein
MGWVVSVMLWLLYPPTRKDTVLILQEAGWPQGRYGRVWKISLPPLFDPLTIQPLSSCCIDYSYWDREFKSH